MYSHLATTYVALCTGRIDHALADEAVRTVIVGRVAVQVLARLRIVVRISVVGTYRRFGTRQRRATDVLSSGRVERALVTTAALTRRLTGDGETLRCELRRASNATRIVLRYAIEARAAVSCRIALSTHFFCFYPTCSRVIPDTIVLTGADVR